MSRATRWTSRSMRGRAMNAAAAPTMIATPAARLANEHPREVHHREAGEQARHDRHAGEALDERTSAGDLFRQLVEHLSNRAGAKAEAEHGDSAGVDEPADPRAGDRRHAADQPQTGQ